MIQSEYVAPEDERIAWLSGFTGSNGYKWMNGDPGYWFIPD